MKVRAGDERDERAAGAAGSAGRRKEEDEGGREDGRRWEGMGRR
jgi:hypothetical protein